MLLRRPWQRDGSITDQLVLASLALSVVAEDLLPLLVAALSSPARVSPTPSALLARRLDAYHPPRAYVGACGAWGADCLVFALTLEITALTHIAKLFLFYGTK